jgi:prepilin peptidase CpaA
MTGHFWIPISVVMVASCIAAITDIWKYRVYNILTIPLFLSGVAYHTVIGYHSEAGAWGGMGASLLAALFGFIVLFVPFLLGLMGAGDVKLLAGVAAWLGLGQTVVVFVATSFVAGIYATVLICYRGKLGESWETIKLIFYRFAVLKVYFGKDDLVETYSTGTEHRLRVIPYGAMIPFGVIGAVLWFYWLA